MAGQTIEQYLVEQLEKVAPGKYTLANVLQLFKTKLRFPCNHLKGGRTPSVSPISRDYNFSIFTFPTGVTEVKCLYNCGLKVRSDQPELVSAFRELKNLPTSNTPAQTERFPLRDPGLVPTYTDADRRRIKESNDTFLDFIERGLKDGRIKPGDSILGGERPHPDPIEEPWSIIERQMPKALAAERKRKSAFTAQNQNTGSAPKPKIKKRKTQSRKRK